MTWEIENCTNDYFFSTELRNKLRYLKHLPVTSTFEVCELEMNIPKFSPEVIDEFKVNNYFISSLFWIWLVR